ncbi:conjugative transfer relaxase/helicase TraI domain-containing protein, partial [Pantoea ananatis]|uniref:conjugative transfer relaxase/helicase TraI domain-containing protein n=1 Tax=Pantoea ananas TaxID=553 RepID=UPI001FF0B0F8
MKFGPGVPDLQKQFEQQVADRDLIRVQVGGEFRYVARATWEMEKTIVREIADGKNAVPALMQSVSGSVTAGLTAGQADGTRLILESKDRFTAIQGYAGTGKTTQFRAVKAGLDTLPESSRPQIVGLTKTQKQAGHTAHEQYRVQALRDNGEVVLKNAAGEKVIEPGKVTADQHIDYAWAVTGYGAQGASAEYVIALEGTEGARQRMSGMRGFYISISRAVDHVQIYTDGMADWMATLRNRDNGPETAHDAIDPQPERSQARLIWGMGKPASKTAIGRTFLREQGLKNSPLTVRIIPPTKKYPEPHLALPVFDGNGKTAGVSLYPISADAGQMTAGAGRELATREAQAAVLQKSRNGETMIVTSLGQGLDAARTHPHTGVILQTGRKTPTDRMLKVAGGQPERAYRSDAALVSLVQHELTDMLRNLPPDGPVRDESALLQAALAALEKSQG